MRTQAKKKQRAVKRFRQIDPKDVKLKPCTFLTPKQWHERWRMKMTHALQMARG